MIRKIWNRIRLLLIKLLQDKEVKEVPEEPHEELISRQPGLVCPECSFKIPISIDMLLSEGPIICPSCKLNLNVEKEASKPILDRLRKLDNVIKEAQKY